MKRLLFYCVLFFVLATTGFVAYKTLYGVKNQTAAKPNASNYFKEVTNNKVVIKNKTAESQTCPTYSDKCVTDMLKKEAKKISTTDDDYQGWLTYENKTLKYKLRYPSNWQIDTTEADKIEDYKDSECCNTATLVIYNQNTRWQLKNNVLYTGGQTLIKEISDREQGCKPSLEAYSNSLEVYAASSCGLKYEGPISILGYSEAFKVTLSRKDTQKILGVEYQSEEKPIIADRTRKGPVGYETYPAISLHYTGENLEENMSVLDKITLSLQAL